MKAISRLVALRTATIVYMSFQSDHDHSNNRIGGKNEKKRKKFKSQ